MKFDDILNTAKWLDKSGDVAKLLCLKELTEQKKFYLTVWGHFSAGKSKLINNILQRDILPVQTRETTAVLTYLQYGTKEECSLIYEDGSAKQYPVDILKDIFQNTDKFQEIQQVDHIEVYIENDLLKTGIILVDTPGVNTIIQKHQNLAVDAIEQSGRILYVLGNAPSQVDKSFIEQIEACGVKVSFVRTKCDYFIENEEDAEISVRKETESIESFIGRNIEYIPVSNEKNNKWFENITEVREVIKKIADQISDEMEEAKEERLKVYSEKYLEELHEEEKRLTEIINGNTQNINSEIEKCEKQLKILEDLRSNIEAKIKKRVENAQKDYQKELERLIMKSVSDFEKALDAEPIEADIGDRTKRLYTEHMTMNIQKIKKMIEYYFDDIVRTETESIWADIKYEDPDISVPTYSEVQQENTRVLEIYKAQLAEVKQNIEDIVKKEKKAKKDLEEFEAEFDEAVYIKDISELEKQLNEIPHETPYRVVEPVGIQPSTVLKKAGTVADLALLLLPGDLIFQGVKTVADTTKIAQILHKMGKTGEIILKTGSKVKGSANAIDKARDAAYAFNAVFKKRPYSSKAEKEKAKQLVDTLAEQTENTFNKFKENKKKGNVLDALSIAYWAEKLGKNFDSEPQMEIDQEKQELWRQQKQKIIEEQQKLSDERIRKKRERGLLREKEKEQEILRQEEERKKQEIEKAWEQQKLLLKQEMKQKAADKFKREYKLYYHDSVSKISDKISEYYFRSVDENLSMYMAVRCAEILREVNEKKKHLDELTVMRTEGENERKLVECRKLLKALERN